MNIENQSSFYSYSYKVALSHSPINTSISISGEQKFTRKPNVFLKQVKRQRSGQGNQFKYISPKSNTSYLSQVSDSNLSFDTETSNILASIQTPKKIYNSPVSPIIQTKKKQKSPHYLNYKSILGQQLKSRRGLLDEQITQANKQIQQLKKQMKEKNLEIEKYKTQYHKMEESLRKYINELISQNRNLETQIHKMKVTIQSKNNRITQIEQQNRQIQQKMHVKLQNKLAEEITQKILELEANNRQKLEVLQKQSEEIKYQRIQIGVLKRKNNEEKLKMLEQQKLGQKNKLLKALLVRCKEKLKKYKEISRRDQSKSMDLRSEADELFCLSEEENDKEKYYSN